MIHVGFASGVKKISAAWVRGVISRTLRSERSAKREVNVYLTDDREIRQINRKFLNHDYATDVISFPPQADPPPAGGKVDFVGQSKNYLGDLVVSVTTAKRLAEELKISFKEELARYLVHGTLHLLGYKDDNSNNKKKMFMRQERIVAQVISARGDAERGPRQRRAKASNGGVRSGRPPRYGLAGRQAPEQKTI